jgi:hypothetical protein
MRQTLTTGIDRLYLHTKDFDISCAKLDQRTTTMWQSTANIETGEEEQVQVTKTAKYWNDKATGISISVNDDGMLAVFNPNRILTNSHHEVRPQAEVLDAIEKVSKRIGIKNIGADLTNASISQIDLCRQANLSYPVEAYFPAFNVLNASRLKRTGYEKGFYFSSSHSEAVFYDKGFQVLKEYKVKGLPATLTRFEQRFKDKRTVGVNLKANSIGGLQLVNVAQVFNDYAMNRVFRNSKQLSIQPASGALRLYLKATKENGLMTFVNHLIIMRGGATSIVESLLDAFGTYEAFRHECIEGGMPVRTFQNNWKRIIDQDKMYQQVMLKKGIKTTDLVQELKDSFQLVA